MHLGSPRQHFLSEEIEALQTTIVSDLSLASSFSNKPAVWSHLDTKAKHTTLQSLMSPKIQMAIPGQKYLVQMSVCKYSESEFIEKF
jgi:hypothetical protein